MRAFGASSMWEEVMTHLEGLKCGPQHAELDAGAYSAAISSCCLQQRWADGLELVGQMRSEGLQPDEFCYSSLIGAIQRRPPEPGGAPSRRSAYGDPRWPGRKVMSVNAVSSRKLASAGFH
ncbi:unnamed protein product [Polarella glacialis]|uniref:Pentatricopeptide repeat-containing protein n=1 Tax=Polarella glacialis TaxID=89957 RepID=A0A813G6L7_POLGL|nr:unnamed protein product [Polarella glacialis]